jgi:NitT/TauT family transport system permease protein
MSVGEERIASKGKNNQVLSNLAGMLLIVLLWYFASLFQPAYALPSPQAVLVVLGELIRSDEFFSQVMISLYRVGTGFALAVTLGVVLGTIMGYVPIVQRLFTPVTLLFQAVPAFCWSLLAILWFGLSDATPIFVIFTVAFPIMVINTWEGTKTVDKNLILMARAFHHDNRSIALKVIFPSIVPFIVAGIRLSFGFGWRLSILAEALGSTSGIGYKIMNAADRFEMVQVIAWTVIIVLVMTLIEYTVFKPLETYFAKWRTV